MQYSSQLQKKANGISGLPCQLFFCAVDGVSQAHPLIKKLDDQSVCMELVSTDPARTWPVYVADEAVRLLEKEMGFSLGQNIDGEHRLTKPWKDWWKRIEAPRPR